MNILMKNNVKTIFSLIFILAIILLNTQNVSAANKNITDDVDLFNNSEEANLNALIADVKSEYGIDIFILTKSSIIGTKQRYMDTYVAANDSYIKNAVLVLINMDTHDRGVQIQGYGTCSSMINNNRIEIILDKIVPSLSNANYYKAMQEFIVQVEKYVAKGEPSSLDLAIENIPHTQNFIVALIISMVIVGILIYKSEGRITTNHTTYSQNGKILGKHDRYTHTTTTRIRKPENNSGSSGGGGGGGGGGGRSSGGRSF